MGEYVLVYDGECEICRRSIAWVRRRDRDGLIESLPYQDPQVSDRFPQVPEERFAQAMQLIASDGARWEGASAVEALLSILPRLGWLTFVFRIPGIRRLADRLYRFVAGNRRLLGCGDHCALDSPDMPGSG